jgi:uncharacterized membrane protein YfcA
VAGAASAPGKDDLIFANCARTIVPGASFGAGLAGFAFAIVTVAVWLHFLPPAQCTVLVAAFGLIVQGCAVWKLRKSIKLARLAPFLIGAAIGVPIVGEILRWASPHSLRFGIGVVLLAFSLYSLIRPKMPSAAEAGRLNRWRRRGGQRGARGCHRVCRHHPDHLVHTA